MHIKENIKYMSIGTIEQYKKKQKSSYCTHS